MKSGVWVLDHDTGYKNIKRDLVKRYRKEAVQRIWKKAGQHWEVLCRRYAHLPETMKPHTDGQMFRMAAVYMALKEAYPEEALEILADGVEKEGRRIAGLLSGLLHIPGMDYVFMRIFFKNAGSFFWRSTGIWQYKTLHIKG